MDQEVNQYYELLIIIMFAINSIIVAVLAFFLKRFFSEVKDNERKTNELDRRGVLLEEKIRSNKEILEQKINLNFQTLSNNIETMHKNLQDQYKNILQRLDNKR